MEHKNVYDLKSVKLHYLAGTAAPVRFACRESAWEEHTLLQLAVNAEKVV